MATQVVTAMRSALRRDVPVVRLQTRPVVSDFWHEHLTALIAEFRQNFELRVFLDQAPVQVANICAIDVDDASRNVAEMMTEMPRFLGTQRHQAATTAVFVEGHQMLARTFRDRIIELGVDPSLARHLRTADEVAGFFRGEYYFAYGSNMDPAQMLTRCPSAMMVCPVVLPEHRMVFNRSGTYRPGGVANIEPSAGERVYGILWKMAATDFTRLDQTEDPRAYRRQRARVFSLRGQPYDCHVYHAIPDQPDLPDHDYLDTLIQAGYNAGLPPEYLTQLRAVAYRSSPTARLPHPPRRPGNSATHHRRGGYTACECFWGYPGTCSGQDRLFCARRRSARISPDGCTRFGVRCASNAGRSRHSPAGPLSLWHTRREAVGCRTARPDQLHEAFTKIVTAPVRALDPYLGSSPSPQSGKERQCLRMRIGRGG